MISGEMPISEQSAAAASADLVLLCADATAGFLELGPDSARRPQIRVGLRSDLGPPAFDAPHNLSVSVRQATGLLLQLGLHLRVLTGAQALDRLVVVDSGARRLLARSRRGSGRRHR